VERDAADGAEARMISFLRDVIEDLEKEQEEGAVPPAQLDAGRPSVRLGQRRRPPTVMKHRRAS